MKKIFFGCLFAVLVSIFLFSNQAYAKKLDMAPDFTLQSIHQDMITLSSFKNEQSVLLFFWATWCPYCQKELNVLNSNYSQLQKDGVELLAIDSGELMTTVQAFVDSLLLAYPVIVDSDQSVTNSYRIIGVPMYVLVNKNGEIIFQDNFFPRDYNDLLSGKSTNSQ